MVRWRRFAYHGDGYREGLCLEETSPHPPQGQLGQPRGQLLLVGCCPGGGSPAVEARNEVESDSGLTL